MPQLKENAKLKASRTHTELRAEIAGRDSAISGTFFKLANELMKKRNTLEPTTKGSYT